MAQQPAGASLHFHARLEVLTVVEFQLRRSPEYVTQLCLKRRSYSARLGLLRAAEFQQQTFAHKGSVEHLAANCGRQDDEGIFEAHLLPLHCSGTSSGEGLGFGVKKDTNRALLGRASKALSSKP